MRMALMILATAVLSSPVAAKIPGPITACPQSGGASKGPFYGVRAVEIVMPPIHPPSLIRVSGKYWLNSRSGRIRLVAARSIGINPRILLLRLDRIADPNAGGTCVPFFGEFPPKRANQVSITDWAGRRITVAVQRIHRRAARRR
jgi:hypothetical protein